MTIHEIQGRRVTTGAQGGSKGDVAPMRDEEVFERGNVNPWSTLLYQNYGFLTLLKLMAKGFSRQDAEEAVQDAMIRAAFLVLTSGRHAVQNWEAWLARTATNAVISYKRKKRPEVPGNLPEFPVAPLEEIDEQEEREARTAAVRAAVQDLPLQQRLVVKYRLDGLNNKQIAEELGLAVHQVVYQWQEARDQLEAQLESWA